MTQVSAIPMTSIVIPTPSRERLTDIAVTLADALHHSDEVWARSAGLTITRGRFTRTYRHPAFDTRQGVTA